MISKKAKKERNKRWTKAEEERRGDQYQGGKERIRWKQAERERKGDDVEGRNVEKRKKKLGESRKGKLRK